MPDINDDIRLFERVLDQPDAERSGFIDRECGSDTARAERLCGLLEGHRRAQDDSWRTHLASPPALGSPTVIGPYRISSRIGEGGMGVVYAAEQREPLQRKVAIKLIKSEADSREVVARFHAERQALALMNHSNIAQILDAGVHEDRPYFVMEYIPGMPITEYCDRRNLSIKDRLRLFIDVCQGVQHAHQKGIIHRDLKPTNVLVMEHDGKATPKIIDFGIAKAVTGRLFEATIHTEMGRIIGTPDYMSPEQADISPLDIDTRTDVYSLGALLYELLSGLTVFGLAESRAGLDEIRRAITAREPTRPSSRFEDPTQDTDGRGAARSSTPEDLQRELRQDLDWITLKALDKDRIRRYASASELAGDVSRYLDGEPVIARPPSRSYRLSKFVRRNRTAVLASSMMVVILVAASAVSLSFAFREAQQRRAAEEAGAALIEEKQHSEELRVEAETARDQALAMTEFLAGDLMAAARPSNARGEGRDVTMREVLDVASERIDDHIEPGGAFEDRPIVEFQLRAVLGATYFELDYYDEAERHLARSYQLGLEHVEPTDNSFLELTTRLGPLYYRIGQSGVAERFYREALDRYTSVYGDDHAEVLLPLGNLGAFFRSEGRLDEAEPIYRDVLDRRRALLGSDHLETIIAEMNMGVLLGEMERLDESLPHAARAVEDSRRVLGSNHVTTLNALSNYGTSLIKCGRLNEAESVLKEAVEGSRIIFGDNHNSTAISLNNYGTALQRLGQLERATEALLEALEINRSVLGDDHRNTVIAMSNIAGVLRDSEDFSRAAELSGEAVERSVRAFPPNHWAAGLMKYRHAESLLGLERFEEARDLALEGHVIVVASLGEDSDRARTAAEIIARIHEAWNEAEPNPELAQAADHWRDRAQVPQSEDAP